MCACVYVQLPFSRTENFSNLDRVTMNPEFHSEIGKSFHGLKISRIDEAKFKASIQKYGSCEVAYPRTCICSELNVYNLIYVSEYQLAT